MTVMSEIMKITMMQNMIMMIKHYTDVDVDEANYESQTVRVGALWD